MNAEIFTPNKSYGRIRSFLRLLFLNGCYSKKTLRKYGIFTDKQYRNYSTLLLEYFREEDHNIKQYSRDSLQMNFEYYETTENYLVNSYYTKSSSSNFISVYFLTLQILNSSKKPLKRSEITEEIYRIYGFDRESEADHFKDLSENSIYKYLKVFVSIDVIGENSDNEFFINKDIFAGLSDNEMADLYHAVTFFSDSIFPSTPGYYLKNTLKRYIKHIRKLNAHENELFLHRFVPFHSVLDDEIVLKILEAIYHNKKIKIEYHKLIFEHSSYTDKEYKFDVCPVKIIFDLSLGRWYLACIDVSNNLSMLRIDRIYNAEHLEERFDYSEAEKHFNEGFKDVWTASIPFNDEKSTEIRLQVNGEIRYILDRITSEGKGGQLTLENDGSCNFTLKVKDETEVLPWIRSLGPNVKIVENDSLKNRMINDLVEMKKNYGIF